MAQVEIFLNREHGRGKLKIEDEKDLLIDAAHPEGFMAGFKIGLKIGYEVNKDCDITPA